MKAYRKAVAGFVGSALTALGTAMADGNITQPELIAALGGALVVGGGLVYAAPRNDYR